MQKGVSKIQFLPVLVTFLVAMAKHPTEISLRQEGLTTIHNLGKAWWQECEETGHIVSAAGKQRGGC